MTKNYFEVIQYRAEISDVDHSSLLDENPTENSYIILRDTIYVPPAEFYRPSHNRGYDHESQNPQKC